MAVLYVQDAVGGAAVNNTSNNKKGGRSSVQYDIISHVVCVSMSYDMRTGFADEWLWLCCL